MTFFTTNYKDLKEAPSYGALPKGEYEMVIAKAAFQANTNGKESLFLDLVVRNDLQGVPDLQATNGKFANRHIFYNLWKRDLNNQYMFDPEHLQYILAGANVPEGMSFSTLEEFENALNGRPVLVYTTVGKDNKGEDRNDVAPWGFKKSAYPQVQHNFEKPNQGQASNNQPVNQAPQQPQYNANMFNQGVPQQQVQQTPPAQPQFQQQQMNFNQPNAFQAPQPPQQQAVNYQQPNLQQAVQDVSQAQGVNQSNNFSFNQDFNQQPTSPFMEDGRPINITEDDLPF